MSHDANADDPPPYRDPIGLHGVHLLTCRTLWYDLQRPQQGFSLAGVYTHMDLPDGATFPVLADRVFVYFQLWGEIGDYHLRIRLVRIEVNELNEEVEVHLGSEGEPREFPMPSNRPAAVSGLNYVEQFAFPIGPVPFQTAGLYEYQLRADEIEEPIARERVMAREWTHDE